jgi:hypothetical protein
MDKETFEKTMYDEWKVSHLDRGLKYCEDPHFDMLWDLRDKLYDFFYPLGITSCSMHDVLEVYSEIRYTESDYDLSIVCVYTEVSGSMKETLDKCHESLKKIQTDYVPKEREPHKDFFVMRGFYKELTHEDVEIFALQHCSELKLVKFISSPYYFDTLEKMYMFKEQFEFQKNLGKKVDGAQDFEQKSKAIFEYSDYKRETERLFEQMIESNRALK